MNFEMLKDAIDLNINEPPTIINALCMIRTVYLNVEAEADMPLSQCPIGDGQLQKELIRVSKKLLSIYEDNSEALQRNRARLESIMQELRTVQTELEKIAEAAELLPGKKAEYEKLLHQLEAARAAHASYEELLQKIEAARTELSTLQSFDFDAAQKQLADLQEQIRGLQDRIRSLDSQLQHSYAEKAQLDRDVDALHKERDQLLQKLAALVQQKEDLQHQITQAQQDQSRLTDEISAARIELDRLQKLIADTIPVLEELQSKVRQLTNEKNQLDAETARLHKQIADLKTNIASLHDELSQKLHPEYDHLTQKKQRLLDEKLWILKEISALTTETSSLDAELVTLRGSLALRKQERDDAQKRVDDYHRDVLDPVISERDALLETEQRLLTEKDAAEKQSAELKSNQQKLILEIGAMKNQYDLDTKAYEKHTARKQELVAKQTELTEKLDTATKALERQQTAYDKLEKEDLPAAEKFLKAETTRLDTLQAKVDGIHEESKEKTDLINKLNEQLPPLQEKLRHKRSVYEALTVTFNSNNQDILELERKIKELEAKNDKERLARYRAQQQETYQKLQELAESCTELDLEILKLNAEIDTKTKNLQILEELKKKKEEGAEGIDKLLEELRPYDTEEYRRQAHSITIQYENLQTIRSNLAQSIRNASKCITGYELTAGEVKVQKLETLLAQAAQHSHSLYQALIECAEAVVKNHITEEPK